MDSRLASPGVSLWASQVTLENALLLAALTAFLGVATSNAWPHIAQGAVQTASRVTPPSLQTCGRPPMRVHVRGPAMEATVMFMAWAAGCGCRMACG